MKLTLDQNEIIGAIRDYVEDAFTVNEGMEVHVTFKAGRKDSGMQAFVDIRPVGAEQLTGGSEALDPSTLTQTVGTTATGKRRGRPPRAANVEAGSADAQARNVDEAIADGVIAETAVPETGPNQAQLTEALAHNAESAGEVVNRAGSEPEAEFDGEPAVVEDVRTAAQTEAQEEPVAPVKSLFNNMKSPANPTA